MTTARRKSTTPKPAPVVEPEVDDEVDDTAPEVDDEIDDTDVDDEPELEDDEVDDEVDDTPKVGVNAERETYTAKQVASRIGTDAKTLRKFFRSSASTVEPCGQGGRYEFDAEDMPQIKKEFDAWKSGKTPRGTGTKSEGGTTRQRRGSRSAPPAAEVIEEDDEVLELDDDEELDDLEPSDDELNDIDDELDDEEDDEE